MKNQEFIEKLKLLILSIDKNICYRGNSDISYGQNKAYEICIDKISELIQDIENYDDGTEMEIKCCDYCSSWEVGSHRCSCGNRRMSLSIDGDFFNGFYAYGEAN